jgi:predicted ATP-dependent endonuclease of OLD family
MKKFIIKSINIHNFKGIADANINFDKDKTILIAPNFSGAFHNK